MKSSIEETRELCLWMAILFLIAGFAFIAIGKCTKMENDDGIEIPQISIMDPLAELTVLESHLESCVALKAPHVDSGEMHERVSAILDAFMEVQGGE